MTEVEDLLRDAYHQAADTIAPDDIRPAPHPPTPAGRPPRFAHNFGLVRPVLAAVAVLLVAAAATLLPRLLTHTAPANRHKPGLLRIAKPGPPPSFFAVLTYNGGALEFFSTSTRKMTGIVVPPSRHVKQRTGTGDRHRQIARNFSGVAAEPDNKTFIVAVQPFHVCMARLYQVHIDSSGQPGRLLPVPGPAIQGLVADLALSPDGSTLAYVAGKCHGTGEVEEIDRANGSTSTWTGQEGEGTSDLSLSAHGAVVGFSTWNFGGIAQPKQRPVTGLLRATGGSAVLDSAAAIVLHEDAQQVLSPDGTVLYACAMRGASYVLYAYDVTSRKRLSVLASWPTERDNPAWPTLGSCAMTMAPDGAHILLGNVRGHLAIFNTVTGHLALSSAAGFNYSDTLSW